MAWMMHDVGLKDVNIDTRIVIFPPDLTAFYFAQTGVAAEKAGVIGAAQLEKWNTQIEDLKKRGRLFCSIGYYLFTATV